jgi:hypothetical protein
MTRPAALVIAINFVVALAMSTGGFRGMRPVPPLRMQRPIADWEASS